MGSWFGGNQSWSCFVRRRRVGAAVFAVTVVLARIGGRSAHG